MAEWDAACVCKVFQRHSSKSTTVTETQQHYHLKLSHVLQQEDTYGSMLWIWTGLQYPNKLHYARRSTIFYKHILTKPASYNIHTVETITCVAAAAQL